MEEKLSPVLKPPFIWAIPSKGKKKTRRKKGKERIISVFLSEFGRKSKPALECEDKGFY